MKPRHNATRSIASASAFGLVIGMMVSPNASADFISCVGSGYDIRGKVSTATDCAILGPLDGKANDSLALVNDKGFFGIGDWLFDGKWDKGDSGFADTSSLFDFTGGGKSGGFSYVGAPGIADILFIFKDGAGTNLTGYLVTQAAGTYTTPFTRLPFPLQGNATVKDVSHVSVYYREGALTPASIPEPGVLILMGAGLLGLGYARSRNSA